MYIREKSPSPAAGLPPPRLWAGHRPYGEWSGATACRPTSVHGLPTIRGRRGYKNSEPSVVKIFNDEGRYEGILDLSQRGLPGAFLSLSRQLPGHTPNHFVPRDLLQD